jgi:hypothetical protein
MIFRMMLSVRAKIYTAKKQWQKRRRTICNSIPIYIYTLIYYYILLYIKVTQTRTVAIMKSIENNIIKTMASKDYDRIISTINSYKELEQRTS